MFRLTSLCAPYGLIAVQCTGQFTEQNLVWSWQGRLYFANPLRSTKQNRYCNCIIIRIDMDVRQQGQRSLCSVPVCILMKHSEVPTVLIANERINMAHKKIDRKREEKKNYNCISLFSSFLIQKNPWKVGGVCVCMPYMVLTSRAMPHLHSAYEHHWFWHGPNRKVLPQKFNNFTWGFRESAIFYFCLVFPCSRAR